MPDASLHTRDSVMAWAIDQLKSKAKIGDWRGLGAFVIRAMYERYYEWRFDIQSGGYIDPGALGIANEESVGYEGTDYRSLSDIMVKLQVRERSDVFLDLGAGKGRRAEGPARGDAWP